jgi:hypothetical protein
MPAVGKPDTYLSALACHRHARSICPSAIAANVAPARSAELGPGSSVAIFGAGQVGLMAACRPVFLVPKISSWSATTNTLVTQRIYQCESRICSGSFCQPRVTELRLYLLA